MRSACRPPAGLPGLQERFSRLVETTGVGEDTGSSRTWHLLDTGPILQEGAFDFTGAEGRLTPAADALPLDVFIVASADPIVIVGEYARITGRAEDDRLPGTIASNIVAWQNGARVFRVHDVREVGDALRVAAATVGDR